jgi:hypothetical protein
MNLIFDFVFRLLGVVGFAFGAFAITVLAPRDSAARTNQDIIKAIAGGGTFTGDRWATIETRAARAEQESPPSAISGQFVTIVRARIFASVADRPNQGDLRPRYDALVAAARAHLTRVPIDGLAWFALGYHQLTFVGMAPSSLLALRQSYAMAPREYWIMRIRNPPLLMAMTNLPAPFPRLAAAEFGLILQEGTIDEAVTIFRPLGSAARDAVMPVILSLPERRREAFGLALRRIGDSQVIPLERHRNPRPWHAD